MRIANTWWVGREGRGERHGQGRASQVPLAIRVGLSLGEVTFEDGDLFGVPVVEAARLVAAAGPGQILATVVVRMVARCAGVSAGRAG
ncbi:MAG: hypothetical protein ACRDZ3_13425 [Acidimicrobiia bacterium]